MSDDALGLAEADAMAGAVVDTLQLYDIELSRLRNATRQAMCGAAYQTLYTQKTLCEIVDYCVCNSVVILWYKNASLPDLVRFSRARVLRVGSCGLWNGRRKGLI